MWKLLLILLLVASPAFAQGVPVDQLPPTSTINTADRFIVQQGVINQGVTRRSTWSLMLTTIQTWLQSTPLAYYQTTESKTSTCTPLAQDSGAVIDNTGAGGEVNCSLPPPSDGLKFCFAVVASQNLRVTAQSSAVISIGNVTSATNGNIVSNAPNSSICLYTPKGSTTLWVALGPSGLWTVN